jgi:hypothetical protein
MLKKTAIGVALASFLGIWGLVAGHVAGATSHGQSAVNGASSQAPSQSSGGFFDNGNNSGSVGPGSGGPPAVSSGSS